MEPMKSEATDPNRKESPVPVKPRHDKKAVAWRHGNSVSATAQSPFGFIQKSFAKTGPSDLGIEEIKIGKANILSLAFYSWMTPLIWRLYRRGIGSVLKLTLMVEDTAEYNVKRLEEAWNDELLTRGPSGARLDRAIRTAYRSCLICSIISVVITLSFSFIGSSFIMRLLLTHIDKSDTPLWKNLGFVLMLVVCELFRSLTFSLGWCFNYWTGMRVRQAAIGLLYKRILQLRSLKDNKIGELMNMCSNDSQRLFEASANGSFVLGGPLVIIAGSVYLFFLIGPWAAVGMCTFILYFVFMKIVSGTLERFRREAVTLTGERVGLMTEVLTCMKLIKVNAWESAFKARLSEKRNEELSALEKASFTQSIIVSMVPMIPAIASVIMFIGHILTGNDLSVVEAFTITAVLYAMAFAMALMIHGIRAIADANVACARFKEVLLLEEMVPYSDNLESDTAVKISKATFAWDMEEETIESTEKDSIIAGITVDELESFTPSIIDVLRTTSRITAEDSEHKCKDENKELKTNLLGNSQEYQKIPQLCDISITAKKGELIGICGMKGSGKSSLLYAIMGRMQLQSGAVRVSGTVAYMGQEPFVMNGTARENITFGLPFDAEKFDRVVSACCLDKDFETFGAGDRVMIGDQGLTLSGGQKQRICLARAVYSESDIYLLDDPLSALDIHIGRHIFTHCLKILLKDKTVFFVTHHLEYMPQCDQVVLLHAGKVMEKGPHLELFETDKGPMYSEVYKLYQCNYNKIQRHRKQTCLSQEGNVKTPQRGFSRWSMHHLSRQLSVVSVHNDCHHQFSALSSSSVLSDHDYADIEKLMCSDEIFVTRVKWSIYKAYIRAMGGYGFLIFLLISFAVSIAIQSAVPGYLAYWLSQGDGSDPRTRQLSNSTTVGHGSVVDNPRVETYALTYGMFLVAMLLLMVLRSYTFVKILLNASRRLHHHLLKCTMTSPMKFFDTTPLAVILNRFSADLDEIDVRLPFNCEMNLQNVFMVLFALVVICYTFPWDLLVVLPLGVIFVVLAVTFAPILQQLKFVDSITRSPYMSHLTASMEGMATIYIYGQTDRFYKQFCGLLDQNSIAFFLFYMANRWLAVFLDLMVIIIIAATGFLIIFTVVDNHSTNSGLALSFAIQITSLLQYTLRLTVEAGSRFTSVQRLQEYVENLQAEGAIAGSCSEVPDDWPSEGAITFSRYTMRYNENLPPVLKGISLAIRPKEKIGIVGNSGSGKSSLGVALFRLCEASSGSIYIDNQNIRDVKLEALRSRISILVQDPVLFEGTVRYNLDPSKSHVKDANLWQALKRCHMKEKIESLESKLDTMVEENGKNFSRGERQLLCLARILLKNSKILVLDEATASVDMHTDFLVQQTIRMYCRDKTVLIIAHRINTIWDCDKVLVMENGKAVEFNSPHVLLQKAHSKFREMYDAMKTMPRGASVKDDEPAESTFDERSESV